MLTTIFNGAKVYNSDYTVCALRRTGRNARFDRFDAADFVAKTQGILEKERGFCAYFAAPGRSNLHIVRSDFEHFANRTQLQEFINR